LDGKDILLWFIYILNAIMVSLFIVLFWAIEDFARYNELIVIILWVGGGLVAIVTFVIAIIHGIITDIK